MRLVVPFLLVVCIVVFVPSLAFGAETSWVAEKTGLPVGLLADLAALLLVSGPFIGNAFAYVFTRLGWFKAAAYAARWAPFATKGASVVLTAPTRDQAIRAVIIEAQKEPELAPISQAASYLADVRLNGDQTPILEAADPKKPSADGSVMGGMVIMSLGVVFFVCLTALFGCVSPRGTAVEVANGVREAGMQAKDVIHDECTTQYQKTSSLERIAELDKKCLPLAALYKGVRGAHIALVAGIQAYDVWGDWSALVPLLERAAKASRLLAESVLAFGQAVDR